MSNTKIVSMLITVEENVNNFTQQQYDLANIAVELYQTVGQPSIKGYTKIVEMNSIKIAQSQWKTLTYVRRYLVSVCKH